MSWRVPVPVFPGSMSTVMGSLPTIGASSSLGIVFPLVSVSGEYVFLYFTVVFPYLSGEWLMLGGLFPSVSKVRPTEVWVLFILTGLRVSRDI